MYSSSVFEFLHDLVFRLVDFAESSVIFEPYIPFFYKPVTLWDILVGFFTLDLILVIFAFHKD